MSREAIQRHLDAVAAEMVGPHENLLVRAWLYSPIAYDVIGRMPLDDILCVAVLRYAGVHMDDLGPFDPEPMRIVPPLARVEVGGSWVYASSWARHYSPVPMIRRKRKHFHDSPYIGPQKVDTRSGKYRSYDLVNSCVASPFIEWTVRGSREWAERLLPLVASLGKDRNAGLGSVIGWEVEPTERDPLVVDGVPQRALPCLDGDVSAYRPGTFELAHRAVRPPYVWTGSRMQCVVPVA